MEIEEFFWTEAARFEGVRLEVQDGVLIIPSNLYTVTLIDIDNKNYVPGNLPGPYFSYPLEGMYDIKTKKILVSFFRNEEGFFEDKIFSTTYLGNGKISGWCEEVYDRKNMHLNTFMYPSVNIPENYLLLNFVYFKENLYAVGGEIITDNKELKRVGKVFKVI